MKARRNGKAERKRTSYVAGPYIISAVVFILLGGWFMVATVRSLNTCRMDVPAATTRSKDKIEAVCSDPLAGTKETFVPGTCPSRYEFMASPCTDLTYRMALREHGIELVECTAAAFVGPIGPVLCALTVAAKDGFAFFLPDPPGNPEQMKKYFADPAVLGQILARANGMTDRESVIVDYVKAAGTSLPTAVLNTFVMDDLNDNGGAKGILSSDNLAKIPVGLDKTIVIKGMTQDDLTLPMVSAVTASEQIVGLWREGVNKGLMNMYTQMGMQIYGSITFSPKYAPAVSYVLTASITGQPVTLLPDRARHLSNAYFTLVEKVGTADAITIAYASNSTVWNAPNPWSAFLVTVDQISSVPCSGSEFCPFQGSARDTLHGIDDGLKQIDKLYASVKDAKAGVYTWLNGGHGCGWLSGPFPVHISTCSALISCNWADRDLTAPLLKNSCLLSAVQQGGSPMLGVPIGVMENSAALEVWDVDLPESTNAQLSGTYAYRPVIKCPIASWLPVDILGWKAEAGKTVVVCTHDLDEKECKKDGTCYYCYTISCAKPVIVETKGATAVTVENTDENTLITGTVYRIR